jgi:hypothetical protein
MMRSLRDVDILYYSDKNSILKLFNYFSNVLVVLKNILDSYSMNVIDNIVKMKVKVIKRTIKALTIVVNNLNNIIKLGAKPMIVFRIRKYLDEAINYYTEFLYYNSLNELYNRIPLKIIKSEI